ncbi:MAG TPA: aldo/keto reductase [Gemmatimonadaceae bacterium]|nr:aldo/keto reductase [Gemmatimonadaceae bacterium]
MDDARRRLSRREALKIGAGAGLAITFAGVDAFGVPLAHAGARATSAPTPAPAPASQTDLLTRPIPSSGERLPIVGMGTARNYEQPAPEQVPALRDVIREFPVMGGRVLDTAPAYGRAESVVGDLMAELKNRDRYFIATKVSLGGRGGGGRRGGGAPGAMAGGADAAKASLDQSLAHLRTDRIDLMQIWNMSQPEVLLPVIDEWKAAGKVRYTGITTSSDRQYEGLEAFMKSRKTDFIQIDFAIDNRTAQERILPLAADRGMAVLINLPFGRGRPFQKVQGKPLPGWAKDMGCTDWSQVFLKYIVGHPAVTCVIPGTEKVEYLKLNLGAARGVLPDAALRRRMEADFDAL